MNAQISNGLFEELKEVGSPLIRPSRFAELTGMAPKTVTGHMDRGELPVVTLCPPAPGKRPTRYINMFALLDHCKKEAEKWIS